LDGEDVIEGVITMIRKGTAEKERLVKEMKAL